MIEYLPLLSTLVLGLFAGSLLTEAMILVPFWRRMKPAEFFNLHGEVGPSLFRYFAPLTCSAVVLNVLLAIVTGTANLFWLVSAGLCLIALAIFFIYFKAANNRFAEHDIRDDELGKELQRWSNWHWLRTMLVIVALVASIQGHVLVV